MSEALDSVTTLKTAKTLTNSRTNGSRRRTLSSRTVLQAARFDSLCVQLECDLIMKTHRAWDSAP